MLKIITCTQCVHRKRCPLSSSYRTIIHWYLFVKRLAFLFLIHYYDHVLHKMFHCAKYVKCCFYFLLVPGFDFQWKYLNLIISQLSDVSIPFMLGNSFHMCSGNVKFSFKYMNIRWTPQTLSITQFFYNTDRKLKFNVFFSTRHT